MHAELATGLEDSRETEIDDLHARLLVQQQVLKLHVTVHDPAFAGDGRVQVAESERPLVDDAKALLPGERR